MGLLDFILRRKTAESVRREYDRLRERADREGAREKRLYVLKTLDEINPLIVILEEQYMSNYEKKAIIARVSGGLKKVRSVLDDKEAFMPMTGGPGRQK